ETHEGNCTGCHDTGGLIRSPYLKQTGLLPAWGEGYDNNGLNPLRYVGHAFAEDRSYRVVAANGRAGEGNQLDPGLNCTSCHWMAVNNVLANGGTSMRFAFQATSPTQRPDDGFVPERKNPASATAPMWMRPDFSGSYPTEYDPFAAATASNYRQCGSFLWGENFNLNPSTWSQMPEPDLGCSFEEHGRPYYSPIQIVNDLTWGNGGSSTGIL